MEKKDLLGVRKKTAAAKRRRKVVTPAKSGGGARRLAEAIANYLACDSYMYAPLVSDTPLPAEAPSQPPATVAPSAPPEPSLSEKEAALVQKYRGTWQATFTDC